MALHYLIFYGLLWQNIDLIGVVVFSRGHIQIHLILFPCTLEFCYELKRYDIKYCCSSMNILFIAVESLLSLKKKKVLQLGLLPNK